MIKKFFLIGMLFILVSCGGGGGDAENGGNIVISQFAAVYSFEADSGVTAYNGMFDKVHGQIIGATRTVGKVGGALDFTGNPDAVVLFDIHTPYSNGIQFTFPDNQLAVGGWFNPSSLLNDQSFQIFGGEFGIRSFALKIDQGVLKLIIYQDGKTNAPVVVAASSTPLASDDEWVHLAATYDGSVGKIYINGMLDSTTNISIAIPGVYNNLFLTFPGKIDEFFFAGLPLDGSDIESIFLDPLPTLPDSVPSVQPSDALFSIKGVESFGPTAHFGFDESAGTVVTNSNFPGMDGELSAVARSLGVVGNAIDFSPFSEGHIHFDLFDVSGSYSLVFPQDEFTIATWIKSDESLAGGTYHLCGDAYSGVQSIKFILEDGFIKVLVFANRTYHLLIEGTSQMEVGQWNHVAVTYDTNQATLYINGIQVATNEITIPIGDVVNDFYIGGLPSSPGSAFPGLMDEFYLSSDVFTPQQVMALAQP